MKALSIKQPWMNFISSGRKTIETRTWTTHHRGPILLCASKSVDQDAVKTWGPKGIVTLLPRGVAICTAKIIDVRLMRREDEEAAMCPWEPGRYAWVLEDIRPLPEFPVKGTLRLFEVKVPTGLGMVGTGGRR